MAGKTTTINIKSYNRTQIFRHLFQKGALSQKEISLNLNLSMPTVIQNLNEMREQNLIIEKGVQDSTGGRKAKKLGINAMAHVALGLDITKHHISIVLVDLLGNILESRRLRCIYQDTPDFYENLAEQVNEILKKQSLSNDFVLGMCISIPAIVKPDHRTITYSRLIPSLPADVEILQHIQGYFPFPAMLMNDASCSGFAEHWYHPDHTDMFYLLLSNSVGGSILFQDQVYPGMNNRSAEIGHTTLMPDGKKCYCGRLGCVDSYCSANYLSDFSENRTLEDFFEKLEQGIPSYQAHWKEYLNYVAMTISNIHMLFDCDIIVGGYVGNFIEPYMDLLKELVMKTEIFSDNADFILPCMLHAESSAVGAALIYIDQFIQSI
ncbi:MAG: ROK family transcriptional regulator [Lachnospiraceae bacterium]|nr:ROK family transcriptional regulator [Lachnospiraceae bacterium]